MIHPQTRTKETQRTLTPNVKAQTNTHLKKTRKKISLHQIVKPACNAKSRHSLIK